MSARIDQVSSPAAAGGPGINVWLIGDDEEVIVIDPGHGPETTIGAAEKQFDSWVAAGSDPSSLPGLGE